MLEGSGKVVRFDLCVLLHFVHIDLPIGMEQYLISQFESLDIGEWSKVLVGVSYVSGQHCVSVIGGVC